MKLSCPLCGGWSVDFSSAEVWCGPSGRPGEFVSGECSQCRSRVLVEPSVQAVETAAARMRAGVKTRKMTRDDDTG